MEINYIRLGERIKNLRKARKMSIDELAQKVHYSVKSIVLVENGQAVISLELFVTLCTVLDIAPNELLEGEYRTSGAPPVASDLMTAKVNELNDLIATFKSLMKDEDSEVLPVNTSDDIAIQKIKEMLCEYKEQHRVKSPNSPYKRR